LAFPVDGVAYENRLANVVAHSDKLIGELSTLNLKLFDE
jgi:hypothetical protein